MLEMNEDYADPTTLEQIKTAFYQNEEFPNIKLSEFFEDPYELSDKVLLLPFERKVDPLHHDFQNAKLTPEMIASLQVSLVGLLRQFNLTSLKETNVYKLTHKSYSMLTDVDEKQTKTTFDIILDLSDEWDEGFGGDVVYVTQSGEPLEIEPSPNTAIIVKREPGTKFFLKYCNHYSKNYERLIVVLSFQ